MLSEVPRCWVKYHHTSAEMQETSKNNNNDDTKYGFPRFGHCASFFWVRHFSWLERESRLRDNFPPPMEIRRRSKEDWHFGSIRLDKAKAKNGWIKFKTILRIRLGPGTCNFSEPLSVKNLKGVIHRGALVFFLPPVSYIYGLLYSTISNLSSL